MARPPLVFTRHAEEMLRERRLRRDWVEMTIANPETLESDPNRPHLFRAFRGIPERDGLSLRVVYEVTESATRVITAFFDRSHRRRLEINIRRHPGYALGSTWHV